MSDSASEGSNSERRRQPRVSCAVTVLCQAGNVSARARLTDLTPDGVSVRSDLQPEKGNAVRISFKPTEGQKIELTGVVVWSAAVEFGVRIDNRDEAYLSFLDTLSSLD